LSTATLLSSSSRSAEIVPVLQRLDELLRQAVVAARDAFGQETVDGAFRGLFIDADEVGRLLASEPGETRLWPEFHDSGDLLDAACDIPALNDLQRRYGLSPFDLQVIVIALAPELDLRYERLYAYLQDDVTKKYPSVDLVLTLLCRSLDERLARRAHFQSDAPLIRNGLVHVHADPGRSFAPLLSCALKLDEQIVRHLLGDGGEDGRLTSFCSLVRPNQPLDDLPLNADHRQALAALVHEARSARQPLRLLFTGPPDSIKRLVAESLAFEQETNLLTADLSRAPREDADCRQSLRLLCREADLRDAVLFLSGLDGAERSERVLDVLTTHQGVTVLDCERSIALPVHDPLGLVEVAFPIPDVAQRREWTRIALAPAGVELAGDDVDAFANRFRLTSDRIHGAVVAARNAGRWRAAGLEPDACADGVTVDDLFAAARAQSGHELATLARKVEPTYCWDDLVLPEDALAQMDEICRRVEHRHRVLSEWGFDDKLALGKGINAMFCGPSGTGKTMAADVIANRLGLDLYRIDLSQVVSKYIGETERNLDRIFSAAHNANVILFFDEADALFGKRSEVRDSHDRYANVEISYLLQKMEEHDELSILATNLRRNMDDAFVRRLTFAILFPQPDVSQRLRIWESIWPHQTPVAADLDLHYMARQFKFTGGNIRNVAVAAAFQAAADGQPVGMTHLIHATRREFQKMSKVIGRQEFGEYAALLADSQP
jgi:SpoVK/Ycf46/Vps4 family AAA+-type ATPase